MGFFDGPKETTQSNSGFLSNEKNAASKYAANRAFEVGNLAYDRMQQPIPQFNMSSSIPGLFKEQEGAANAFANNMFAKASAGGALRGQFSINNTPGIVGSAITNMGSTLLPLISQNLQNQMLVPEQIFAQRTQNAMSPLQALISGLGSSASGERTSAGMGYTLGNNFLGSFGTGMGSGLASMAMSGMSGGLPNPAAIKG